MQIQVQFKIRILHPCKYMHNSKLEENYIQEVMVTLKEELIINVIFNLTSVVVVVHLKYV